MNTPTPARPALDASELAAKLKAVYEMAAPHHSNANAGAIAYHIYKIGPDVVAALRSLADMRGALEEARLELLPAKLRTLTARAEAAERELATERTLREAAEWAAKNTKGERVIELEQRAEAAEARAEGARAEALEEAARLLEVRGWNGAHNSPVQMIRALRTAPPPTAGQR